MTLVAPERGPLITQLEGEPYLCIRNVDRIPPFLMTLASDDDLWMFVSSYGGLTAGRISPDHSLFPYVTVDRLHEAHHTTGPLTWLRARRAGALPVLWRPFAEPGDPPPGIERHLYKDVTGSRLLFEETHRDLGLVFRYRWSACAAFGHVRTATLEELRGEPARVDVLDGLRNLLPAGAALALTQHSSPLVTAYQRNECDPEAGLGILSLESPISDRAEPGESLRANVVACTGLPGARITLSADAPREFRHGRPLPIEHRVTGRSGHFFAFAHLDLPAGGGARWHLLADAARTQAQVMALRERLGAEGDPPSALDYALDSARARLCGLVASADGVQVTGESATTVHHFANVLFNVMRGGLFARDHRVPVDDFIGFVGRRDRRVAERHTAWLQQLRPTLVIAELREAAARTGDPDLERLAHEYLPIHFGRRHGDPSRPWNRFSIHVRDEQDRSVLAYEGNWRDIFQNWEALARSFPAFLPNMIAVFMNGSTIDGFNPYRLTRDGVDWEVEDPDDPWSNIGYWGDHQVIYLLKLLEDLQRTQPGALEELLPRRIFSYADVPYRIVPFARMLEQPRATIRFDRERAARVASRVEAVGCDGRLLADGDGQVVRATLLEKLLVPVLAKLSNLVPGSGIWMNTQRPEWNDANNALVGHGVSLVTLGYLRRHMAFLRGVLAADPVAEVPVAREVARWLAEVSHALQPPTGAGETSTLDGRARLALLLRLGEVFARYREQVYAEGFSGVESVSHSQVVAMLDAALWHADQALAAARRADGLYHAYGRLELDLAKGDLFVRPLDLMLEGQVSALSSGCVGPADAAQLLDALFASSLYRADQGSFLLYRARQRPDFLQRNVIPPDRVAAIKLLDFLLVQGDSRLVLRDPAGVLRFHPDMVHEAALVRALDRLAGEGGWCKLVARDRDAVLRLYEDVFEHRSFTGRSGCMYAYEGIGCIYWHMVAKLLLAIQEVHDRAQRDGESPAILAALAAHYHRVRGGLGFAKTPESFGAFPSDPYSHTPASGGAQQPGMTGQVKEEILARFGELGVTVEQGRVSFRPRLLAGSEYLREPAVFEWLDLEGAAREIRLAPGTLAFTYAHTPVIYRLTDGEGWVRVVGSAGVGSRHAGDSLSEADSQELLGRTGALEHIEVGVPRGRFAAQ